MRNDQDTERMLSEILSEGNGAAFEKDCLVEMLHSVNRQRQGRRLRRRVSICAAVVIGVLLAWAAPWGGRHLQGVEKSSCEIVTTRPLPTSCWVTTRSVPSGAIVYVASRSFALPVSTEQRTYSNISDGELLALVAPSGGAVLLRTGPDAQRLVFVAPAN